MSGFKQQAISGVKWTTIATLTTAIIQLLRLSILTRYLEKSDFGIIAILTFVLGLTNTFADLGFSSSIMHKQRLTEIQFSSLYWIQFIFFIFLFGIGTLLSPLISNFYNVDSISYLLPIVLLDLIFMGIGRLYDTVLQKDLLFKKIAIRNIITALASLLVAIVLAIRGYGIYSLILSTLFQTFLFNIWNFVSGQKCLKLRWTININEVYPLVKIGFYQTGTQLLDYFSAKFDVLIIGKLLGTEALGIYNLAKEFVMKVILLINSIANKVVLPLFAKFQNDHNLLRENYCKVINILSKINFPICVLICILSKQIVYIIYGNEYEDVALLMSILSLWSIFLTIGNPIGNIAIATGKTNLSFKYTILRIVLAIPILYFACLINIVAVAWSNVIMSFLLFLLGWKLLLNKIIGLSFKQYISSISKEVISSLLIGLILYVIVSDNILNLNDNAFIQSVLYGCLVIFIYVLVYTYMYGINFYKKI